MDIKQREHARQLEVLANCPENINISREEVEIISVEPRIYYKDRMVAEPDLLIWGNDNTLYVVEYKASYKQRGIEQLNTARDYLKVCRSPLPRNIKLLFAFKAEGGCSLDCIDVK